MFESLLALDEFFLEENAFEANDIKEFLCINLCGWSTDGSLFSLFDAIFSFSVFLTAVCDTQGSKLSDIPNLNNKHK